MAGTLWAASFIKLCVRPRDGALWSPGGRAVSAHHHNNQDRGANHLSHNRGGCPHTCPGLATQGCHMLVGAPPRGGSGSPCGGRPTSGGAAHAAGVLPGEVAMAVLADPVARPDWVCMRFVAPTPPPAGCPGCPGSASSPAGCPGCPGAASCSAAPAPPFPPDEAPAGEAVPLTPASGGGEKGRQRHTPDASACGTPPADQPPPWRSPGGTARRSRLGDLPRALLIAEPQEP